MCVTHGYAGQCKQFNWVLQDDYVKIKNANGRQHEYSLSEILAVLMWLDRFDGDWFPLANNVLKLGLDTEVDGLGVAILRQQPGNIGHAQGASYLGVVLDHVEILEWNGKHRGIQWRIIHPVQNLDELRRAIKAKMACGCDRPMSIL